MNCFKTFAVVFLLSQGVTSQRQCEVDWTHRSGFCYFFSQTLSAQSNWEGAKQDCRDRSGNIATIINEDIWDWVVTQMTSRGLGEHWIGLRKTNNQFYWDDGTVVDSSNFYWADNGESQRPDTCVVATRNGWREELCTESSYYHMCYKKATARDHGADALVVFGAIIGSLFILCVLVLTAYCLIPEAEVKHEKLEKYVKRSDEQDNKQIRQGKGDPESGVQEVGNVTSEGHYENTDLVDEVEIKKRRTERKDDDGSGRDVAKGRTTQKAAVKSKSASTQSYDVESGRLQRTTVKRDVQDTRPKGHDNKAFNNNDE